MANFSLVKFEVRLQKPNNITELKPTNKKFEARKKEKECLKPDLQVELLQRTMFSKTKLYFTTLTILVH